MILSMALALAASTATSSVQVDVGRFDTKDFPNVIKLDRRLPHGNMTNRVEKLFRNGTCDIDGQSKRRFDITVPYAVLMDKTGTLQKVVVAEVGCAALESLVGQVVIAQAGRGDFRPQHQDGARWYASDLNFTSGEQMQAPTGAEADKVICKRGEPVLGTRTKIVKVCRTAAEWHAYRLDRQQIQRDLQNSSRDDSIE